MKTKDIEIGKWYKIASGKYQTGGKVLAVERVERRVWNGYGTSLSTSPMVLVKLAGDVWIADHIDDRGRWVVPAKVKRLIGDDDAMAALVAERERQEAERQARRDSAVAVADRLDELLGGRTSIGHRDTIAIHLSVEEAQALIARLEGEASE